MTKPAPAAVAFRTKLRTEGHDWPKDLRNAATLLQCELDRVVYKHWQPGGRERLAGYLADFSGLYSKWIQTAAK